MRLGLSTAVAVVSLLLLGAPAAQALAPTNTMLPTITAPGSPQVGNTLTYTPGIWSDLTATVTDVWMRCTASTACTQIPGTTANQGSYTLATGDVGDTIEIRETAQSGPDSASVSSLPTASVTAGPPPPAQPPANTSPPTITGMPTVGQVLSEHNGVWTSASPITFSYAWLRCPPAPGTCALIANQAGPSYTLTSADVGQTIEVQETAQNAVGAASATSGSTPSVTAAPGPVISTTATSVVISPPTAVTNQPVTLIATVSSGSSATPPAGTLTFESDGVPISGCAHLAVAGSAQTVTVPCQMTFGAGVLAVTAQFTPGPGVAVTGSTSAKVGLVIGKALSAAAVAASPNVGVGKVTYTATVGALNPGAGAIGPTGRVAFTDRGSPISGCASRPLAGGAATCTVNYTRPGGHRIAAQYGGDINFVSSLSSPQAVAVSRLAPQGFVTSTMSWTFAYTRSYTRITQLVANGLSSGVTITLACRGRGCPFRHHTSITRRLRRCPPSRGQRCAAARMMQLTSLFRRARLGVGAQLTVVVAHPNWLGKYYRFAIRSGRPPRVVTSCLAVGARQPGSGC